MIRVLLAENQGRSRAVIHHFIQTGERYSIVADVGCYADLLSTAGACQPDFVLIEWDLPGLGTLACPPSGNRTSAMLLKKLVVELLHSLACRPTVIFLCDLPDAVYPAQQTGADVVFYQAELSDRSLAALDRIQPNGNFACA